MPFTNSLNKHVLSFYVDPGSMLAIGDISTKKTVSILQESKIAISALLVLIL